MSPRDATRRDTINVNHVAKTDANHSHALRQRLRVSDPGTVVFLRNEALGGCGDGHWLRVLKANERKSTFHLKGFFW